MNVVLPKPILSLFRGWVATSNACRDAASKLPRKSKPLSNQDDHMSNNYPMAGYSDYTLDRMQTFFEHYKPNYQDVEWAKQKKAEIAAEIERRKLEDREGEQ